MQYVAEFRPSVWKNVKNIPEKDLLRIKRPIDRICKDLPDPATTKISGNNTFHKVRCGDYRIIYEIHNDRLVILVVKIGQRKGIYKKLS